MNRKNTVLAYLGAIAGCAVIFIAGYQFLAGESQTQQTAMPSLNENEAEMKAGRAEYFFTLLRDPATNEIPAGIRSRELEYSKQLPTREQYPMQYPGRLKAAAQTQFDWSFVGPNDVGGRTRALGIDRRNSNIIIAGGVSGGIWKSTDGGSTWAMKTDPSQNMSVSSLAQDPNNPDTWYYASGEIRGNSAGARGGGAFYHGTGIFKSTNNGESWSRLASTLDSDTDWNSPYDYVSRIVASPSGSVFIASNGFGIYRSTDGTNFSQVLDLDGRYVDVAVASDSTLVATSGTADFDNNGSTGSGIYVSENDGGTWTNITPTSFPSEHQRSVVDFAPSAPGIMYVFTEKAAGDTTHQGVSFFKIDISAGVGSSVASDRSANLPNFSGRGNVNTQGNYNMLVSVKPDDPNFVLIGGTNLYRSRDGFASAPADNDSDGVSDDSDIDEYWIGGYGSSNFLYPNHHPDQHVVAFDPSNPDIMWSGHDGGLGLTSDVTVTGKVSWSDMNQGYNITQFYTVAIPAASGDSRVVGGTQDNGSPFFNLDGSLNQVGASDDISSGDGSYTHFTDNLIFVSSQRGRIIKWTTDGSGQPSSWSRVDPGGASNQLFIHPYESDPSNEAVMYYPAGTTMYRSTNMDQSSPTWSSFSAVSGSGYNISTLEASETPSHTLYYAASSSNQVPLIYRLENSNTSTSAVDVSITAAPSGAYVHDLAVNPDNANEVVAVMSNYNITGLYHTTNAGGSWTAIEGNLTGDNFNPGPSLRSARIVPTALGNIYLVGTSTGIYSTTTLDGNNTQWVREGSANIGFAVVEYLDSRKSDGTVAAGTHGRGIFLGTFNGNVSTDGPPAAPTGLDLSIGSTDITLDWNDNFESDLLRYRVYRGTDSENLALYDSSSTSSFTDSGAGFNTYFYKVTAVDDSLQEGSPTEFTTAYREFHDVNNNWKLVSTPLNSADNALVPSGSQLVGFSGAYNVATRMQPKKGYWLKAAGTDSIAYDGSAMTSAVITLEKGWNLLGSLADSITTNGIIDPAGDVLGATPIYEYSGGAYQAASQIRTGEGYWIFAEKTGTIEMVLADTTASKVLAAAPVAGNSYDEVRFSRNGATQSIFVAGQPLQDEEKQRYRMPPMAPEPVLDVRTREGFNVVETGKTELFLPDHSYPVRVSLHPSAGSSGEGYRLEGINGDDVSFYPLKPGEPQVIETSFEHLYLVPGEGSMQIRETALLPNYPNPFNPSTTVKYRLSARSEVTLEVYTILGRKVRTLVNTMQQPGEYTVTFDGRDLASGTYFINMRAGDFVKVRKVTLIK